jgi:hypothetical protein
VSYSGKRVVLVRRLAALWVFWSQAQLAQRERSEVLGEDGIVSITMRAAARDVGCARSALFRLRCRRRFEPLVRWGVWIVPDAIEFRDQVDCLAGDGRSWMPLCLLTGLSAVVALPGRNLARSLRATCLLMTFSTTLPQALRVSIPRPVLSFARLKA